MHTSTKPANYSEFESVLNSLETTPATLKSIAEKLTDDQLRFKPARDVFSFLENVCHLRDLEREGYTERIRRILDEDAPALADFDGGRIAAERNYNAEDFSKALEAFTQARRENMGRIKTCDATALGRTANLEGVGPITLERLAIMMSEHDSDHLQQISDLLNAG